MNIKNLILAGAFAFASSAVSPALAHAKLENSEPKANSTLEAAPKLIRLQFNETLEPAFSTIKLSDAANTDIALSKTEIDKADTKAMVANVPPLRSGEYLVQWSAMTRDGHKRKGQFSFKVK